MRKVNNDSMSPPRAMTLQGAGGREPPAGPARHHAPLSPPSIYFIKQFTLIRLYLLFLRVISCLHDAAIPRTGANFNFPKRPLVKLKAVTSVFAFRTRILCCNVIALLVNAIEQLFVVAKCIVCVTRIRGGGQMVLPLLLLSGLLRYSDGRRDNDLHIGGIFPMEGEGGWQGGQACKPAAELALADVNARSDLLSGFKLLLHSNDSKVNCLILILSWSLSLLIRNYTVYISIN